MESTTFLWVLSTVSTAAVRAPSTASIAAFCVASASLPGAEPRDSSAAWMAYSTACAMRLGSLCSSSVTPFAKFPGVDTMASTISLTRLVTAPLTVFTTLAPASWAPFTTLADALWAAPVTPVAMALGALATASWVSLRVFSTKRCGAILKSSIALLFRSSCSIFAFCCAAFCSRMVASTFSWAAFCIAAGRFLRVSAMLSLASFGAALTLAIASSMVR
mmetsp:Transcript_51728/g.152443  ORF Transcript_51728/g.152443 Transcript_51728/m.152443 type:complete len:219 (-) Transcript_51728:423-1079(-)